MNWIGIALLFPYLYSISVYDIYLIKIPLKSIRLILKTTIFLMRFVEFQATK